jgi:HSP20 family molecular chaperone IbpA
MTDKQEVANRAADERARTEREPALVMVPPADVFEDAEGITLQLDMPGVSKEHLVVEANKNALTIEGTVRIDMPSDMTALYADMRSRLYRRSFVLSDELEPDRTDASLRDGVLQVRIPKRAEVRPRRIEVRVA